MDLRHLRYFVAVAENELVTRAAQRLRVSQPPLSRAIREFESELGVDLFRRQKQRLTLTAVGAVLLDDAKAILSRVNGFKQRAQSLSSGEQGRIRVGYVDGAMQGGLLSKHLRELRARCPSLAVDLVPLNSELQLKALADGVIDAGIVYTPRSESDDVVVHKLLADRQLLALPVDDRLAGKRRIRPPDLDGAAWVVVPREEDPNWQARFAQRCASAGFRPEVRYEVSQLSAMLGLVEAGVGRGFVPASATRAEVPGVKFRSLSWWTHTVDFWLAWRKQTPPPAVRQLLLANGISAD
ncbi:DNA-binding transcriptional regulator, LysR family [Mesorhizobium sp. NFR06]|uniref:LysR family transcriptional regulator n=1 Tax=Mesorhizobium sp. NFR06 TaxID=1566290 RepID=UPI0008EBAE15|nr:LysR family transcriptional regulator [Mesorhizobium sp. NFR06]SFP88735.1 DNA-binding transcriptional regulator, LysR family [Mesorhizobium sp. NFR06]